MKALVLAAGKSTRIASVSAGLPKPLLRIGGDSVLGHNLRWLGRSGIRDVWVNLHHRPDEIRGAIGDGAQYGLHVQYSYESELLGTAGAARKLDSVWDAAFLVVYGDNLVRFDLQELAHFHHQTKRQVSIALFNANLNPHTGIAGGRVKLAADRRIEAFLEGAEDGFSPLVNAGVYVLEPETVPFIPLEQPYDFSRDLFPVLLSRGAALYGYVMNGYCLGLDTPESYRRALELIEKGKVNLA